MITHDAAWDTLLTDNLGFRPAVRATAWRPGSGATLDVPVTEGWVLKDASQYPRTHVQVTCADTSLVPKVPDSLLQPNGAFLKVEYGYTDAAGVTTWITVADGPITQVFTDVPAGVLNVESADLSVLPSSFSLYDGTTISYAGTTASMYQELGVWARQGGSGARPTWPGYGGVDYGGLTAAQKALTVPETYQVANRTAWEVVEDLADMLGAEAFYDSRRYLVARTVPVVGVPAFAFTVGPRGTMTQYQSEFRRSANVVKLVYGTRVGVWTDQDPESPTLYTPGGYEFVVAEDRTGTPSQGDADAAAREYARRVRGAGRGYTLRAVPVPWLEPGDTVSVSPVGTTTEYHLVQSVSLPLGLDAMTLTTRNPTYSSVI